MRGGRGGRVVQGEGAWRGVRVRSERSVFALTG